MTVTRDQIEQQVAATTAAREAQAVGADFAPDYELVDGVRFYRPTLAHTWFALRWHGCKEAGALPSYTDYALVIVAALMHDADYVLNTMMSKVNDVPGLVADCYADLLAAGATPATADKVILGVGRELFAAAKSQEGGAAAENPRADASSLTGGRA